MSCVICLVLWVACGRQLRNSSKYSYLMKIQIASVEHYPRSLPFPPSCAGAPGVRQCVWLLASWTLVGVEVSGPAKRPGEKHWPHSAGGERTSLPSTVHPSNSHAIWPPRRKPTKLPGISISSSWQIWPICVVLKKGHFKRTKACLVPRNWGRKKKNTTWFIYKNYQLKLKSLTVLTLCE